MASWFETHGAAAILSMRVQDLVLRRLDKPSHCNGVARHQLAERHRRCFSRLPQPFMLHHCRHWPLLVSR